MNQLILKPFNDESGVSISESVTIDGTPYFTRLAIGEWLGYPAPQKAIDKIIERNPHINNPEWSVAVKLTATDGKKYDTKVYNPVGLQLIVFESNQPRAIEYKIAVAKMVAEMIRPDYPLIVRDRFLKKLLALPPWVPKSKRKKPNPSKLKKSIEPPYDEAEATAHHEEFLNELESL